MLPVVPFGMDTWLHVAGYAALSASSSLALAANGRGIQTAIGSVVAVAFGLGVELLQTAVPTRSFAWSDVVANAVARARWRRLVALPEGFYSSGG